MPELIQSSADSTETNSLYHDSVLFDMYMRALDVVLNEPEVLSASDEFDLSAATLRMWMVRYSDRALQAAPREFAAYKDAVARERGSSAVDAWQISLGSRMDASGVLRLVWIGYATLGAAIIVAGLASIAVWSGADPLVWLGGTIFTVALLLWLALKALGTDVGSRLLGGEGSRDVAAAREKLMAAVRGEELLAQLRTFINFRRTGRFGHEYSVVGSPGLSEAYDVLNRVPTANAAELDGMLTRFDGASIGIAGPRGSGKSTLIREYCERVTPDTFDDDVSKWPWQFDYDLPVRARGDLRCIVAAPVDYAARDFVLHLFASFCRSVIVSYGRDGSPRGAILRVFWLRRGFNLIISLLWKVIFYGLPAIALVYWQEAISRRFSVPETWVETAAVTILFMGILEFLLSAVTRIRVWIREVRGGDEEALAAVARRHLSRVRYLQTYTSGWSGTLALPSLKAGVQHSRAISHAEQALSYPEIVDEFRNFARGVADKIHRRGARVFIGVDELDKIGSAEQGERFLNEIKGIFGISHLYFMVSVSDDALTAFERRGLPLRDAFDSSFDEIIHVGPLSYAESRRLLYRRVIGLTEPYVALCHCLAGGLARDVIRAARQVVRTAANLTVTGLGPNAAEGLIDASISYMLLDLQRSQRPLTLSLISTSLIKNELLRKLRAVSHVINNLAPKNGTNLQETLYDIASGPALEGSIMKVVDLVAQPARDEPVAVASLRLDFAAYAYYCATLQEIFTDKLDGERIIAATSDPGPGTFDALAAARNGFALDTLMAWRLISRFRQAWSLDTREPVKSPSERGR